MKNGTIHFILILSKDQPHSLSSEADIWRLTKMASGFLLRPDDSTSYWWSMADRSTTIREKSRAKIERHHGEWSKPWKKIISRGGSVQPVLFLSHDLPNGMTPHRVGGGQNL